MKIFLILFSMIFVFANENIDESKQVDIKNVKNPWIEILKNYRKYQNTKVKLEQLEQNLKKYEKKDTNQAILIQEEIMLLKSNFEIYDFAEKSPLHEAFIPFENTIEIINKKKANFFAILSDEAEKYEKNTISEYKKQKRNYDEANKILSLNLSKLNTNLDANNTNKQDITNQIQNIIRDKNIINTTIKLIEKKKEQTLDKIKTYKDEISNARVEVLKKIMIVGIILVLLYIFMFLLKKMIFHYIKSSNHEEEEQRKFALKKLMNVIYAFLSLLIISLAYVQNVTYALTIFGVIGAGITISSKEWVLSVVAWINMLVSSYIKLGDRIKIESLNPVIGDVIDISLTKITLFENLTNDSINDYKRAGRIIFVPNYYILTYSVFNFTHMKMQTIVDMIEFNLSYKSDLQKAENIAIQVTNDLSRHYSAMAQRQYDVLKTKYTLRNMSNYPKVVFVSDAKTNQICMSIAYITPYRKVLRFKSKLTKSLLNEFLKEETIYLAN